MKLVFLTQVLDRGDAVLGFVPRWIEGLARRCERVRVVALEVGDVRDLPGNVDVRELGRRGRIGRYLRMRGFLREALQADGFDAVLAHMVPRYALLAAGPARRAQARLYLWYTHGAVDGRLVRAERVVRAIFTASEESLRLETARKRVTGHGIDLKHFDARGEAPARPARLLAVGRLTPAKDPLTLVEAVRLLVASGRDVSLDLVGGALAAGDAQYVEQLRAAVRAARMDQRVTFHGAVPYREVPALYRRAALLVSPSRTGSVDKVVLEAMACERPVLTCNAAFPRLFAELGGQAQALLFPAGDARILAERAAALLDLPDEQRQALGRSLRALVARDHEVDALMGRLCAAMEARA